ncbi:MAG: HEAT repeat domain-containing protein [Vulcanimicrobiota bacterium]
MNISDRECHYFRQGGKNMLDTPLVIKKLSDPLVSLFEKIEVINQLEKEGGTQALSILVQLLSNEDSYIRREVAHALGVTGNQSTVQTLLPLLGDSDSEVRKNTVVAMGKLGGSIASEGISKALQDESWIVRYFAERALSDLNDKNSGQARPPNSPQNIALPHAASKPREESLLMKPSPQKTEKALAADEPTSPAPVTDEKISIDSLIDRIIDGTTIKKERISQGFLLTILLPDGRKQNIFVSFREDDADKTELIVLYTTCGKAAPNLYKWALTANAKMPYGGIALRQIDGEDYFTISYTSIISSATAKSMRKIVMDLAAKGDWIEKNLSKDGGDRF